MSNVSSVAISEIHQLTGKLPVKMSYETLDELVDILSGKALVEMYNILDSEKTEAKDKISAFGKITGWAQYSIHRKEFESEKKDNKFDFGDLEIKVEDEL